MTTKQNTLIQTQFEHAAMVTRLAKPGFEILQSLDPRKCHLLHMGIGIVGEVLELSQAMQAAADQSIEKFDDVLKNLKEELGDIWFYVEGLLQSEYFAEMQEIRSSKTASCKEVTLTDCADLILDGAKRLVMYDSKEKGMPKLIAGLKDLIPLLDAIAGHYVISRVEVLEANLNKLLVGPNARYKEGTYSNEQAVGRSDKDGADA